MAEKTAIAVHHVSKDFILPNESTNSVKSRLISVFSGGRDKSVDIQHALHDISFEIKEGEFFGIVGRNGSGKSTMLKILAQIYQPTKGSIHTEGKLVPFIELGVGFNPELSGRENVYLNGAMLGFSEKEVDAMYDAIVAFAELEPFMDQKLKNYSSGMQVRLAFSMATRAQADILLVDEVLAVGDADFQRKCFDYFRTLKKNRKTVVFVSHDMNAIRDYCDRAALIEKSELVMIGNAQKVASAYSKLFIPKDEASTSDEDTESRYGSRDISIESVHARQTSSDGAGKILINAKLVAHIDCENPRIGFSLKDSFLRPLVGTNTKLEHFKLGKLRVGQHFNIQFELEDIYKQGDYTIDFSVEDEAGTMVYDWWEEATSFWIKKDSNTAFVVSPPVTISSDDAA